MKSIALHAFYQSEVVDALSITWDDAVAQAMMGNVEISSALRFFCLVNTFSGVHIIHGGNLPQKSTDHNSRNILDNCAGGG